MSLFGSLFTGVSALNAQSQSMSVISNNIANVNTTGYKRTEMNFSSLVTATGRSSDFSPGGVRSIGTGTVDQQGLLQQSSSTTDVSISGQGFFTVQRDSDDAVGSETFYTRSGSFTEDSRGFLKNSSGFTLMGWPLDPQGNLPPANSDVSSLRPVDVAFLGGLTRPTTEADIVINLDARQADDTADPATPHFTRAIRVYDSLGTAQDLTLEFTRDTPAVNNSWTMDVRPTSSAASTASVVTQTLVFDGSGSLDPAASTPAITPDADNNLIITAPGIDWGNGSNLQDISLDITDFSMFSGDYNVVTAQQNGAELGLRTGVSIDRDGLVIASFSNGKTAELYKLPIATFTNPNGLESLTGNIWRETTTSGDYNLREPGAGGAGTISPASLENSNVDLADEFSKMIITQRAYSAGTKVISTSDQMMAELMQLR